MKNLEFIHPSHHFTPSTILLHSPQSHCYSPFLLCRFTFLPAILLPCPPTIRPPLVTHPTQPQHCCQLHRTHLPSQSPVIQHTGIPKSRLKLSPRLRRTYRIPCFHWWYTGIWSGKSAIAVFSPHLASLPETETLLQPPPYYFIMDVLSVLIFNYCFVVFSYYELHTSTIDVTLPGLLWHWLDSVLAPK